MSVYSPLESPPEQRSTGNPIMPGRGLVDPHAIVEEDRIYVMLGKDASWDTSDLWDMPENQLWSTDNLVDWRHETTVHRSETADPKRCRWMSGDIIRRGDTLYHAHSCGPNGTGLLVAPFPGGPFRDHLGHLLLEKSQFSDTKPYDADFFEEDGEVYLIFGCPRYYLAKFNSTMTGFVDPPQAIEIHGVPHASDKPNLFKEGDTYYLAYGRHYAISKHLYGPYDYQGAFFEGGHSSVIHWKGQRYLFFECPDVGLFYRGFAIQHLKLRDDGSVHPGTMDPMGVGHYDATRPRLQAEEYYEGSPGLVTRQSRSGEGDFEVRNLCNGSWLHYPRVRNLPVNPNLTVLYARAPQGAAALEIWGDACDGPLLGTLQLDSTGGWDNYRRAEALLDSDTGTRDLYIRVIGEDFEALRLDWFSFAPDAPAPSIPRRDWDFTASAYGFRAITGDGFTWQPGIGLTGDAASGIMLQSCTWPIPDLDHLGNFIVRMRHGGMAAKARLSLLIVPHRIAFWQDAVANWDEARVIEFDVEGASAGWVDYRLEVGPQPEAEKFHLMGLRLEPVIGSNGGEWVIERIIVEK